MDAPRITDFADGSDRDGGRLLSIHYLRAMAAVMVVAYHIYSHGLLIGAPSAGLLWLKEGVAIFFVISGFVMIRTTAHSASSPLEFFARRVLRVAPLYWIATLLWVAGAQDTDWTKVAKSLAFVPLIDTDTGQMAQPSLDVGWSLNYEMAFYLLFAVALAAPRRWTVWLATAVLVGLMAADQTLGARAFVLPYRDSALLDFIAGMWIAHLRLRAPVWCLPLGFAALACFPQLTGLRALSVTLPAMLIVAAARSIDRRPFRSRLLDLLGDASYAIYLSHMFVIATGYAILQRTLGHPSPLSLLVLPIALAFGLLVHRTVEVPLNRLAKRPFRRGGFVQARHQIA